MSQEIRDSGICCDNDNDSSTTSSCGRLSHVQKLKKRFECLAKEESTEFHQETNWWLEEDQIDDDGEEEDDGSIVDVRNEIFMRENSTESANRNFSKQSSYKSETSRNGDLELTITPATPEQNHSHAKEFPTITLSDYRRDNETNDSDSFESESDEEENGNVNENGAEQQQLNADQLRHKQPNTNRSALTRPASTISQTST